MGWNEIIYKVSINAVCCLKCLQERGQFNLSEQVLSGIATVFAALQEFLYHQAK